VTQSKIKISDQLVYAIMNQFLATKRTVDQAALKLSYKSFFPNVKLPETQLPTDTEKPQKTKKKKGSKRKKKRILKLKNKRKVYNYHIFIR
jgi:hypothetical protein